MRLENLTVLVVDDEPAVREVLRLRIEAWGPRVVLAGDVAEAERALAESPDVVVSDIILPDASGLELLARLTAEDATLPVILMTAHGSVDVAVEGMKKGARDFLLKPLDYAKLQALILSAAMEVEARREARALDERLERGGAGLGGLVGTSRPMRELYRLIELLAASDASAILTGESGTGKEVVARTVHEMSRRRGGPFVAVNAAAIPEGLVESELFGHEQGAFTGATHARAGCFELSNGGTLLLDEIAEMPIALQPKLLRILEAGKVRRLAGRNEIPLNVRVLAATNRPPAQAIREGRLREDLFYRLGVFELALPPLRERMDDLPLLARAFISEFNAKHGTEVEGLAEDARALLETYAWPGNVRELRNVLERAVVLARTHWVEQAHLPPYLRAHVPGGEPTITIPLGITAAEAERRLILRTLELVGQNKSEAARRLGMDVKTLRTRLKSYGVAEPAG